MTTYGVLPWTLGLPHVEALDKLRDAHGEDYPALTELAAADTSPAHDDRHHSVMATGAVPSSRAEDAEPTGPRAIEIGWSKRLGFPSVNVRGQPASRSEP